MAAKKPQTSNFYITVTGRSDDPRVKFYYGVWLVTVRASPKASSVALAFFKSQNDIPRKDSQTYLVEDENGQSCQDLCEADDDAGPDSYVRRVSFDYPELRSNRPL